MSLPWFGFFSDTNIHKSLVNTTPGMMCLFVRTTPHSTYCLFFFSFFFFLTLTPIHPLHTQEREVHTLVLLPPSCHLAALELTPPPNPKFQRFDLLFGGGDAYACVCVCLRGRRRSRWVVHMLRSEAPLRPKKLLGSVNTHCGESKHSQHAI